MASYYSQVQDAITGNEQELKHLEEELRGLRLVEKDTPRESYQRQYAQILYHMEQEQRRLEENRTLLESYNAAQHAISELRTSRENPELDQLRSLLATERDPQIRREITEEIEAKEREHATRISTLESTVTSNMALLTDELAEELRNSFLEEDRKENEAATAQNAAVEESKESPDETATDAVVQEEKEQPTEAENAHVVTDAPVSEDKIQTRLQNDYDRASEEYDEATRLYNESIVEFQRIFAEERTRREQEGPFATEEELDAFIADYMRQKIEEDERFKEARDRMTKASKRMASIDKKLKEHAVSVEKAASLNISIEEYTRIKKTVESKEVLSAIYEQRGLGEVNRRTKTGKETAREVSEEAITRIVEEFRQNNSSNIIEAINVIYGTDLQVKAGGSRTTTVTTDEIKNVSTNQRQKVKVRKVSHRGEHKEQEPVQGPPIISRGENKPDVSATTTETTSSSDNSSEGSAPTETKTEVESTPTDTTSTTETNAETTTQSDNSSKDTATTDTAQAEQVDLIPRGMNPDGTYRLTKEDIIQDDLGRRPIPNNTGATQTGNGTNPPSAEETPENEVSPTGQTTDATTKEPETKVVNPPQVLYGPPANGDEQIIDVVTTTPPVTPPTKTEVKVDKPQQVLYGPPTNGDEEVIDVVTTTPTPKKEEPKRGLLTIIDGLTEGLELGKKDGKRLRASNIKCMQEFRDELSSGNYLYNIVHLVPAIVKLPFKLIQKISGKIMLSANAKENAKVLKERLSKLSEEDLMTLYTEYRGNRVIQERFPTVFNTLLNERMQEFAMSKVTAINTELEQRYANAFVAIRELEAVDRSLADGTLSAEDRKSLQEYRANLLRGQAENIKSIRQGYIDANGWLSGGAHGFSEDMKAATTKLSVVGKRFAKDHDLDNELLHKQAQLERAEMKAISDGDDEMALRIFVQAESILSANTEVNGSIFGKRSTGKKYYSPLAEQLDYRDDPFVRDLFTTIAVTSAAASAVRSATSAQEQANIMAENERIMDRNNQTMDQVNQIGADIAGKRGVMMEGMEAQGMSDTLSGANEIERAVLDKTNWGLGTSAYKTADSAGHTYYTDFYTAAKSSYENIAQQYASGQITQAEAMELIADVTARTHDTFSQINQACLDILKPYAQSHPQFDLSGVQGAMEYLQQNPDAIHAMNQAMVDVTKAGDVLAEMQLEQLVPLTTLPSTIRTTVINAAATAALAANISNTMGAKKHTYGNEVTEMVGEYVESQQQPTNENTSTR